MVEGTQTILLFHVIDVYFQTCGLLFTVHALKCIHLFPRNYKAAFLLWLRNISCSHQNKGNSQQTHLAPGDHFRLLKNESELANDS